MNNVYRDRIHNYFYWYGIKETKENFKKLEKVINKNDYLIYEQISNLTENCLIIKNDGCGLIIEIGYEENEQLLKYFLLENLDKEEPKKKSGTDTKLGICLLN